jgi:hypothetical protein
MVDYRFNHPLNQRQIKEMDLEKNSDFGCSNYLYNIFCVQVRRIEIITKE